MKYFTFQRIEDSSSGLASRLDKVRLGEEEVKEKEDEVKVVNDDDVKVHATFIFNY